MGISAVCKEAQAASSFDFVQGDQSLDVHLIVPSVYFPTIENWYTAPVKLLASVF